MELKGDNKIRLKTKAINGFLCDNVRWGIIHNILQTIASVCLYFIIPIIMSYALCQPIAKDY